MTKEPKTTDELLAAIAETIRDIHRQIQELLNRRGGQ